MPVDEVPDGGGWSAPSMKDGVLFAQAPASALGRIVALLIHLDDSTKENGPLRVIEGSHKFGVLNDAGIDRLIRTGRVVECLVKRGGIVAMSPLILHASSKISKDLPRRVLHIEYSDTPDFGNGVRLGSA